MALTTVTQLTVFNPTMPENPYPITVVRIKRTNEFAIIRQITYLKGKYFLNYLVEIENKEGLYCAFHDAIVLEHLSEETQ